MIIHLSKINNTKSENMSHREPNNEDLFQSLINVQNGINQMNTVVNRNSQNIEMIKDTLGQITTILQKLVDSESCQNKTLETDSQTIPYSKSPSIPEEVNALSLAPVKGDCIKSIIEDESNFVGRGSFGTVFGGNYNGQAVAIKTLTQDSNEANEELLHELKVMHCYPAENILPLLAYCIEPPCLIFQYMHNGSLSQKLRDENNPLTWRQRSNIALGIARGLCHLHGNKIVHGDIKSNNILLDRHLEPKIGDFGTVQLLYNSSGKETTCLPNTYVSGLTEYYLPKWYTEERKYGRSVRKAIDIFSLGIVLLEIISGRLPGNKDPQNRSLRDFVNEDIQYHDIPPPEFIVPGDENDRLFNIPTFDGVLPSDWANILFDIAKGCTIDQTEDCPNPWKYVLSIEQIHQGLNNCNVCYLLHLGQKPLQIVPEDEINALAETVRTRFRTERK